MAGELKTVMYAVYLSKNSCTASKRRNAEEEGREKVDCVHILTCFPTGFCWHGRSDSAGGHWQERTTNGRRRRKGCPWHHLWTGNGWGLLQPPPHTAPADLHHMVAETVPAKGDHCWKLGCAETSAACLPSCCWHWQEILGTAEWVEFFFFFSFLSSFKKCIVLHVCWFCCLSAFLNIANNNPNTTLVCPHGLTFSWWGCYSLCPRHEPAELAHSFFSVLVSVSVFMALSTVFLSINSPNKSPLSHSVLLALFCLTGPFSYMSLYDSLLQPWYNCLWLIGFKTPIN